MLRRLPPSFPSFRNLDFQLKSITYPNDTIYHLKIDTQISYPNTITITGTWGGETDLHKITGFITDDFELVCSWSSEPGTSPDHFIYDAALTWNFLTWKLHGNVTDKSGALLLGPGEVSGLAVK
jgi:hypothetical protein